MKKSKKKKNILHLLMFKMDTSANSIDLLFQTFNKNEKLKISSQVHYFFKIKKCTKNC